VDKRGEEMEKRGEEEMEKRGEEEVETSCCPRKQSDRLRQEDDEQRKTHTHTHTHTERHTDTHTHRLKPSLLFLLQVSTRVINSNTIFSRIFVVFVYVGVFFARCS